MNTIKEIRVVGKEIEEIQVKFNARWGKVSDDWWTLCEFVDGSETKNFLLKLNDMILEFNQKQRKEYLISL